MALKSLTTFNDCKKQGQSPSERTGKSSRGSDKKVGNMMKRGSEKKLGNMMSIYLLKKKKYR